MSRRALQLPSAKHIYKFLILHPVVTNIVQIADFEHLTDALEDTKKNLNELQSKNYETVDNSTDLIISNAF